MRLPLVHDRLGIDCLLPSAGNLKGPSQPPRRPLPLPLNLLATVLEAVSFFPLSMTWDRLVPGGPTLIDDLLVRKKNPEKLGLARRQRRNVQALLHVIQVLISAGLVVLAPVLKRPIAASIDSSTRPLSRSLFPRGYQRIPHQPRSPHYQPELTGKL